MSHMNESYEIGREHMYPNNMRQYEYVMWDMTHGNRRGEVHDLRPFPYMNELYELGVSRMNESCLTSHEK